MADHGNGGGDQPGQWKKDEPPLERKHDVGRIEESDHNEKSDEFGPGFRRWLVKESFGLQLFA